MEKITCDEIVRKIEYIKHSQLITDPFPEITNQFQLSNLFGKKKNLEISPHAAYMQGYNKAYKEIMDYFKASSGDSSRQNELA